MKTKNKALALAALYTTLIGCQSTANVPDYLTSRKIAKPIAIKIEKEPVSVVPKTITQTVQKPNYLTGLSNLVGTLTSSFRKVTDPIANYFGSAAKSLREIVVPTYTPSKRERFFTALLRGEAKAYQASNIIDYEMDLISDELDRRMGTPNPIASAIITPEERQRLRNLTFEQLVQRVNLLISTQKSANRALDMIEKEKKRVLLEPLTPEEKSK